MIPSYFSERFSVRNFQKGKVSDDQIAEILEAAMRAPTCGNMQLYSVIVTRNKELKKKLEELHFNQPAAQTADVILTICADYKRFTRWCEINNADPGYDNFHSFITALTDAVIYAQQIVTIAEMDGLSTCYLGTVNYNANEISELLNLPDLVIPVASIALGVYEKKDSQVERLPLESIMHNEKYRDDSDEDIKRFFTIKDNFIPNKTFVEENNQPSLAHVFTEIRYPKTMNETVSKTFMELLKKKGFLKD